MVENWLFLLTSDMPAPDDWETPEHAIRAFEELTGLRVTLHDLTVPLWPYLSPERFKHHSPCCLAVKATHDWACMDFEMTRLRSDILSHPDGRCHQCHAGFVEWVMPALIEGKLAWIFFAGQARASNFQPTLDVRKTPAGGSTRHPLQTVSQARSEVILEALRQLRARFMEWYQKHARATREGKSDCKDRAARAHVVRTFLFDHHARQLTVADLARHLGLGESRTIHLVRECFGCGFAALLNQMRLKTAASLLRNSSHSVQEVCYASGFGDLSHFHRTFRRHIGTTPLQYRKSRGP